MTESPKVPASEPLYPGSFKYTPLEWLRNVYVGFCQGLFNEAPPGSYHWDEDDDTTEIIIQDESPIEEEVMNKRPLVVISRGPIQAYGLGMDDMLQYSPDISRKTKSILVPGTITINACSRVSMEAENIAWVIFEHIWLLRDLIIQAGVFDTGRNCTLGAPSPAGAIITNDSGDEWVAVPITVPFQFVRTSEFTPLGKQIVNNIQNRLSIGGVSTVNNLGPPPISNGGMPLSAYYCPPGALTDATDVRGRTPDPGKSREYYLPKQRHPLDPARMVHVRTVRPFQPGLRPLVVPSGDGVPIPLPCMEES